MAKANKVDSPELVALKEEATALGVSFGATIGEAGLQKKVDEFKASQEAPAEGEETKEGVDPKPESTKPPMKPLNESANVKPKEPKPEWSGKPKSCAGNNSFYEDTKENFPVLKTAKGSKTSYSKDFLESKVKAGTMQEDNGIYSPVTK